MAVIYGPIVVMNELGRKAIKVGSLGAGEVVPVFEKDLDMEGGVKLRTSLGWFSTMVSQRHLPPYFLGHFSPVLRRLFAVLLRFPASWRQDGENGRKMA